MKRSIILFITSGLLLGNLFAQDDYMYAEPDDDEQKMSIGFDFHTIPSQFVEELAEGGVAMGAYFSVELSGGLVIEPHFLPSLEP